MTTLAKLMSVAKEFGYDLWYDRRLHLWTLTHERYDTEYYPPTAFAKLTADELRATLKHNTEKDSI